MPPARQRADEHDRLNTLWKAGILDTPPEKEYNHIARILSRMSGCPISLVSLVDEHRQWFKAKVGDVGNEMTRSISFCDHIVESRERLVIHDCTTHPKVFDNPLVTGEQNVFRCYIGYPIIPASTQHCLGALCCIDTVPHEEISEDLITGLAELANIVGALIDRNLKIAAHEEKTNLFVAKISHELRTPLHGILGLSDTLKDDPTIGREARETVDHIACCARGNLR